jgi:hypothetical protein
MSPKRKPSNPGARAAARLPSKQRLEELVREAIIDAYGESEQRIVFLTMLDENLALPFETQVLGVSVVVVRVDLTAADEIVAVCRSGAQRQAIPILELPLPTPRRPAARNGSKRTATGLAEYERNGSQKVPPTDLGSGSTRVRGTVSHTSTFRWRASSA